MRSLIVDDENMPANYLAAMLKQNFPEFVEVIIAVGALEGKKMLEQQHFDVLFLDIEMPVYNGFELLEEVKVTDKTKIIFTTAYENYALEAFRAKAIDYLVKPIDELQLFKAIKKIGNQKIVDVKTETMTIYSESEYYVVEQSKIIRIEADGSYCKIFTEDKTFLSSKKLKLICSEISASQFFRCHNSHIINLSKILKIGRGKRKGRGSYVVLMNDEIVPISASKFQGLSELIGM